MGTSTVLLPLTGWALVGAFGLVIVLALACVFFVRGVRMLRKAEELAPHMMALEALKADIAKAEGEMDNLRSKLENAKTTIAQADEARQYIEEHQPRVESMRREEELLQTNLTVAKDRLQKATEAYTDQEEKVNQLHKQATDLQQTLDFQEARLREVQAETTRLQSDRKQLEAAIAALSKKRQEVEMALASLAAKQAELERLDREIDRLRAEVAELSLQHSKLTQQNDNLKITQSKLNASIQELIAKESEARIACKKAEKELEALRRELEALRAELAKAEAARDAANDEAKAAVEKKITLDGQNVKLKNDIKWTEDVLKGLRAQVAATKQKIAELEGKLEALIKEYNEKQDGETRVKRVWEDLDKPVVTEPKRKAAAKTEDELKWLAGFNTLLRTHGFHFPERTLRAFHTGLKCGETTPLVVLAGISGTGKSLLPELYAAAAGMNFLSVPVQPRWDGPQDVLGFYNYMEGRYKATELARFLWQADRWNNRDGADAFSADALNIVLLDEMNLARVEYYFADFLSKLEQRRGKNLDVPEQRKAVELFLECGAGLGGRNLCVGTNTFFIGTMNEDETTQMLSDKVIDRSNLLRFGRPDDMQEARPDKGAFLEACAGRAKVTLPLWKAWSQPKAVPQQEYQKLLKDLNDALDKVGRPFAYRVQQSVDAYMAAYPDPNDWRKAFADQIEMKVLPKLNGLEIASSPKFTETAGVIQKIIDGLGDEDLKKEFDQASNTDNTFFRWRGVMRKVTSKK